MAKTIYVRGEGGAIIAMDLPLPESIQERYERGLIQRVHSDGSPYYTAPTPEPDEGDGDGDGDKGETGGQQPSDPGRPNVNAAKADWVEYVAKRGVLSREDAAAYTKADLIDMVS
ncbi:hypothetical protein ACIP9H_29365 [Streptomyces sp. NPDC088732]|uniref:hypothetical protein n=1 Tax=Streptomyces sp. NPDC088732 TaxID=3365879 RepID=UPI0037FDA2D9